MLQTIIAGLVLIAAGLAFSVFGYQLFRFLLPFWGFIFGLFFGGYVANTLFGESALGGVITAVSALGLAILLTILANRYYIIGILLISASIGALVIGLILLALGVQSQTVLLIAVLVAAVVLALVGYYRQVWRYYIITITAAIGAEIILAGILLILGRIVPTDLWNFSVLGNVLSESLIWLLVWVLLTAGGIWAQATFTPKQAFEPPDN